jgi:hypothetical protein
MGDGRTRDFQPAISLRQRVASFIGSHNEPVPVKNSIGWACLTLHAPRRRSL